MKKALSCILVLAMFLSLSVFGGWSGRALADTPEDRIGTYVLTDLVMDGENYTELLSSAGIVFTLDLYADGTGLLVEGEDQLPLTWDENYIYDEDGVAVSYTFADGVLIMTESSMIMTFQKQEQEDEEEPIERIPNAELNPVGTWTGSFDMGSFIAAEVPELDGLMGTALAAITVELREDGTYSLLLDAAPMVPSLQAALYTYVGQICEENGLTIEQLEEAYGSSVDVLVEDAMKDFDLDAINQYAEGVYQVTDGVVLFDDGSTRGIFTGDTLIVDMDEYGEVVLSRAGIYGMWLAEVDLAAYLSDSDPDLVEAIEGVSLPVILELRSDGSFDLSIDAETMLPALHIALRGWLETYLTDNGMTVETFESITGQTLDDLLDSIFLSQGFAELQTSFSGTYEEENGQLKLDNGSGSPLVGVLNDTTLSIEADELGDLIFVQVINEDVLAKGEGVMTYAEYAAAELDSPVVIEAYVLDHQSWWNDQICVYAQDAEGGYYMYNMACSEEDAALLVPGQKIRVTGYKGEWAGETEIVDASFEFVKGSYSFRPVDITEVWGTVDMIQYQNRYVSFKGAVVEPYDETGAAFAYKDPDRRTDDLYFKVTIGDTTYEFCVEYYLRGNDTEVYKTVENLQVGDVIDLEGFLFWYNGPNLHTTSVTVH